MYTAGTILKRNKPFSKDEEWFPYNEVKVIGNSPVKEQGQPSEWAGQLGTQVSISPVTFGGVVDRPFGELQRDYEVVSIPDPPRVPTPHRTGPPPAANGPSPEDKFRAETVALSGD